MGDNARLFIKATIHTDLSLKSCCQIHRLDLLLSSIIVQCSVLVEDPFIPPNPSLYQQ